MCVTDSLSDCICPPVGLDTPLCLPVCACLLSLSDD